MPRNPRRAYVGCRRSPVFEGNEKRKDDAYLGTVLAKRQVFLKGKELVFTKKEFDLLLCLASHLGRVFSREQLYDYVWDDKIVFNVDSVIKTHISSLRQKMIDADVEYIKNVWGLGYKFNNEE